MRREIDWALEVQMQCNGLKAIKINKLGRYVGLGYQNEVKRLGAKMR